VVFCTEFLDMWWFESSCIGRVYGADGAVHGTIILYCSKKLSESLISCLTAVTNK